MAEERKRRRSVPPWMTKAHRGVKGGIAKLRNTPVSLAQRLAGSPAAMAALAAALGLAAVGSASTAFVTANDLSDRVAAVERTVSEAETLLASMSSEVESLQGSAGELASEVGALAEAIANGDEQAAAEIAAEARERAALLREQSARLDGLASELVALDDTTVGAEAVARVAENVRELSDRLSSTNATLDALAGNVAGVQDDLAAAEGTLASVSESVGALRDDLLATNATVAALGSELHSVGERATDALDAAESALEVANGATVRLPVTLSVHANTRTRGEPGEAIKALPLPEDPPPGNWQIIVVASISNTSCAGQIIVEGVDGTAAASLDIAAGVEGEQFRLFPGNGGTIHGDGWQIRSRVIPPDDGSTHCSLQAVVTFLPGAV